MSHPALLQACGCHEGIVRDCPKLLDLMKRNDDIRLGLNPMQCECSYKRDHLHLCVTNYRFRTDPSKPIVIVPQVKQDTNYTITDTGMIHELLALIVLGELIPFDDRPVTDMPALEDVSQ